MPNAKSLVQHVCDADPDQCLTREQTRGLLEVSESTLDAWHARKLPPPRIDLNGLPRYRAGDVCAFMRGHRPAANAGLLEPKMRGGRRPKVVHASFAQFAASAAHDDEWPFLMVNDPSSPRCRPIDLVATLSMSDISDDDKLEYMTLAVYADALAVFAAGQKTQAAADHLCKR